MEGALTSAGVPEALTSALGRCLFRRYVRGCPNVHTRLSCVTRAYQQSGDAGVAAVREQLQLDYRAAQKGTATRFRSFRGKRE